MWTASQILFESLMQKIIVDKIIWRVFYFLFLGPKKR